MSSRYPRGCKLPFFSYSISLKKWGVEEQDSAKQTLRKQTMVRGAVLFFLTGDAFGSLPTKGLQVEMGDVSTSDPSGGEMTAKFPKVIKIYLQLLEKQNTQGMP